MVGWLDFHTLADEEVATHFFSFASSATSVIDRVGGLIV